MMNRSHATWRMFAIAAVVLVLAAPAAFAQTSSPGGVVEQTQVTTDAQGNTVTTELTMSNGILVKEEQKVVSPQGQLISQVEKTFDPATGQVLKMEVTTVQNGAQVEQTFEMQNGQLVLVNQDQEQELEQEDVNDNQGPGNQNGHEDEHEDHDQHGGSGSESEGGE